MRTRRKRGRTLILGAVNVAVILGAALIIQSQASSDVVPSYSSSSFTIPDESDLAFTRDITPRAAVASAPAPGKSDPSASVAASSISSVPTTDSTATERESLLDEIWYAEPSSAHATFPSLLDDSSSWPALAGSPTSWSNPQPTSLGGSSSRGRYAGGFGGGGSSPGGGMGGQSNPRSGSADPAAPAAALRGSADGPTAAVAGGPAFGPNANLPQGTSFSGLNTQTGFSFPLLQFPGNGSGGPVPTGLASPDVTPQSTVTTLQTPVSVPEPGSVLLLSTGLTLAAAYRSRRRSKR